jgi:peptide/nickel transport system permease protein
MRNYLIRRALELIPVLFAITFVSFWLVSKMGDPFATLIINPHVRPEDIQRLRHIWHWDEPLVIRFVYWLKDFVYPKAGWGLSILAPGRNVLEVIKSRIPITMAFSATSMVLAIVISVPLGIYSALHQYSVSDYGLTFFAFFGMSMPTFWFGIMLMYLFAVKVHWFPAAGAHSAFLIVEGMHVEFSEAPKIRQFIDTAWHLALPIFVLVVFQTGAWLRYMRSSMLEVKHQDYVRTARAKGVNDRTVIYKHAFRNAIIPIITLIGLSFPGLIGGAMITETIFAIDGIGRLTFKAVMSQDVFVAMALITIFAVLIVLGNFIADILYAVVDPRIRYS